MKVLVVGNGGREHAIAWKLKQSPQVTELICTPRNPGMESLGGRVLDIAADNIPALVDFALANRVDFTVVGPEQPLSLGIVNAFQAKGLKIFGPTREAARIESSKTFAKNLMVKYGVPTALFRTFTSTDGLEAYIRSFPVPPVIKADGLAAGKGVIVAQTHDEALSEATAILVSGKFGKAGASILVEERMEGPEASVFALTDGLHFKTFAVAQDHKRVFDNDLGPNTGGMGAYAPAAIVTPALLKQIGEKILTPVIEGMAKEGCPYVGILYAGLMLTPTGPRVIEFNCRFGDPETQVVLPLFTGDLLEAFLAAVNGTVAQLTLQNRPGAAVSVVLASGGYPEAYEKGKPITGTGAAEKAGALLFHAGTARKEGALVTSGGRVMNVVGTGSDLRSAIAAAYQAIENVHFDKMMFRKDIGKKGL